MVRVRVVSDLHVGSEWGLWPPDFRYEGRSYPQTLAQQWLWDCWVHMLQHAPRPDIWVVNGDVIEGPQGRSGGEGTMSTDLDIQQMAALEVLRPAVEGRRWYCVAGTSYHEPTRLTPVARLLGADRVHDILLLRIGRHLVEARHHPDAGMTLYRATALEREVIWSLLRSTTRQAHRPTTVVLSHRHEYASVQVYGTTVVLTPCWQLQTRWARARRAKTWLPTIGYVDLVLDDEEPWPHVMPVTYALPESEVEDAVVEAQPRQTQAQRRAARAAAQARRRA